jgi:hypothetical protein
MISSVSQFAKKPFPLLIAELSLVNQWLENSYRSAVHKSLEHGVFRHLDREVERCFVLLVPGHPLVVSGAVNTSEPSGTRYGAVVANGQKESCFPKYFRQGFSSKPSSFAESNTLR